MNKDNPVPSLVLTFEIDENPKYIEAVKEEIEKKYPSVINVEVQNGVETNKVQPKCLQCKTDTLTNGWFGMCDDCLKALHG